MTYDTQNPSRAWDFLVYDEELFIDFWRTINALPVGSVIATGFLDDGLVYFEKIEGDWRIVQVDNPNVADVFEVGSTVEGESAVIDAGGDIEVAYVVKEIQS